MNSTTPDLAAIRARHAASTPGTWITTADIDDPHSPWGLEIICVGDYDDPDARLNHIVRVPDHDDRPADLCFIADAHQDIPALLDMIERLQTQRRQDDAEINQSSAADQIAELRALLTRAETAPDTETALDLAIGAYKTAAGYISKIEELQKAAKDLIAEIFTETGQTEAKSSAGRAYVTAPSASASYDAKALDALAKSSAELAAILAPHRTIRERAGVLAIR